MKSLKLVSKNTVEYDDLEPIIHRLIAFENHMENFVKNHPEYTYHTTVYVGPEKIGIIEAVLKDAEADKGADREDS